MLTNNYYAAWCAGQGSGYPILTKSDGTTFGANESGWNRIQLGPAKACSEIVFGTGTTPPTRDDYALSGTNITSSLSRQDETISKETLANGVKVIHSMFIKNTSSEPVTIGEVAWRQSFLYTSNNAYSGILLDRTVLQEPITIPAGEVGQINYSIFFPYGN